MNSKYLTSLSVAQDIGVSPESDSKGYMRLEATLFPNMHVYVLSNKCKEIFTLVLGEVRAPLQLVLKADPYEKTCSASLPVLIRSLHHHCHPH